MVMLVGCDPEMFLVDRETGTPVPAVGLIPGTKEEPFPVPHGAIQVDGLACEINIDPASSFTEFNDNLTSVLATLEGMIPANLTFSHASTIVFPEEALAKLPEKALVLGCDPDWNAYTLEPNPHPERPVPGFSTAAGHVHFGIGVFEDWKTEQHIAQIARFIKAMDRFVGTRSVAIDPDPQRRNLYGKAGAFRPKKYGGEYRTPSNGWIWTEKGRRTIWDATHKALDFMAVQNAPDMIDEDVIDAINRSDVAECEAIIDFFGR